MGFSMIVPKTYVESTLKPFIIQKCKLPPNNLIERFNRFLESKPLTSFENILVHCGIKTLEYYLFQLKKVDYEGDSALGAAASIGNYQVLLTIAKKIGTQHLNMGNYKGLTPLHLAAAAKNCNLSFITTAYLLELGAEVNAISRTQAILTWHLFVCHSPLTEAAAANNIAAAVLLLRHGARTDWMEDNANWNDLVNNQVYNNIQKAKKYSITDNEKLLLISKFAKDSLFNILPKELILEILKIKLLLSLVDNTDIKLHLIRHKLLCS